MGWRYRNTLSASLLLCILLLTLPPQPLARTWRVPSECPTIKAGLDSATSGDTVMVAPGTYLETLDPETWIRPGPGEHLVSEDGPEATIIEVCDTGIGIVFFECERASVSGFTIRTGSGPDCGHPPSLTEGISCYDCTNVIVEDCIIEDFNYGICIEGASSKWWLPAFRNNIIRSCAFGIYCFETIEVGSPFFENNVITDCNYGALFYDSCPMLS